MKKLSRFNRFLLKMCGPVLIQYAAYKMLIEVEVKDEELHMIPFMEVVELYSKKYGLEFTDF